MNHVLFLGALLSFPILVAGQGTVTFYNRATSGSPLGVVAPIYGIDPGFPTCGAKSGNTATGNPTPIPTGTQTYAGALLTGTGYTAALWGVNVNRPDSELLDPKTPALA